MLDRETTKSGLQHSLDHNRVHGKMKEFVERALLSDENLDEFIKNTVKNGDSILTKEDVTITHSCEYCGKKEEPYKEKAYMEKESIYYITKIGTESLDWGCSYLRLYCEHCGKEHV